MKTYFGYTGYQILEMKGCPIKLPHSKSMTSAKIDYEYMQKQIFDWYKNNYKLRMINFFERYFQLLKLF